MHEEANGVERRGRRILRRSKWLREADSYGVVLVCLVLLYTASVVMEGALGVLVQAVLASVTLVLAFFASGARTAWIVVAIVVSAMAVTTSAVNLITNYDPALPLFATTLLWLMLLVSPIVILRRLLDHKQVTSTTILGAICVYVLIGLMFAFAYFVIDSHTGSDFFASVDQPSQSDITYFSFVTLTTLGYGDLAPATDGGRALAVLEALAGQLFLVTLLARLVSLYRSPGQEKPEDDSADDVSESVPANLDAG